MDSLTYIHAADLHLDTPFTGLRRRNFGGEQLPRLMREASFIAMKNLARICEREKPDFVVLAGDVYNQEECSVKAQLALRDFCESMERLDIPVFIAHGNHDPLASRLKTLKLPANTVVFGSHAEMHPLLRNGEKLAIIHGASHTDNRESRNLASEFRRAGEDCFQLGVLHCAVDNVGDGDRYAPCSLEDLINTGLDAWALGHVHQRAVLRESPFIAYSGNMQGLHVNESGPRGCFVVRARKDGSRWTCEAKFEQTAPMIWEKLDVDVEDIDNIEDIDDVLRSSVDRVRAVHPDAGGIILSIRLLGRTEQDANLRMPATQTALAERLADFFRDARPRVWIREMEAATRKVVDMDAYLAREDLLGEMLRLSRSIQANPESFTQFTQKCLDPFFAKNRVGHYLSSFEESQLREAFAQAEYLCQSLLEKE